MIDAWLSAALPTAVAAILLLAPGLVVVWSGWGLRRLGPILTIPGISVAIIAGSAVIAPWLGLDWGLLAPACVTVLAGAVAFVLRRTQRGSEAATAAPTFLWTAAALALAGVILLLQFVWAFTSPESIAQRFDNIVHLNTVQYAVLTGNASPFHIGDTSDIGFYPNGWHALASLTAQLSGADIPTAVNAANLAIIAIVWPFSNVALANALFGARPVALVTAALLSPGFGAFPALFFDWGVLYPNALGYSLIPAALAAFVWLIRARSPQVALRDGLLFALLTAGMTLAHPNALLALVVFAILLGTGLLAVESRESARPLPWKRLAAVVGIGAIAAGFLWTFARTGADHAVWSPTQNLPQAVGSALAVTARGESPTLVLTLLLVIGLITVARRPRWVPLLLPFIAASALYVIVSGLPADHVLRLALTNPWYQDWNRLAALLPLTAIPVMTLGALSVERLVRDTVNRTPALRREPGRTLSIGTGGIVLILAVASIATGPSVRSMLEGVRAAYSDGGYNILSADERALLNRLDQHVPADALILDNPRNGSSLAYAFAARDVTELHIFGTRTDDERFIRNELKHIDSDPEVCAALERVGVDFVLDFGSYDVSGDDDAREYAGMVNLPESPHFVLRDSEGDARLYEIAGCTT